MTEDQVNKIMECFDNMAAILGAPKISASINNTLNYATKEVKDLIAKQVKEDIAKATKDAITQASDILKDKELMNKLKTLSPEDVS